MHPSTPSTLCPDEVVALYLTGLSREAVAVKLGVGLHPVRTILDARGVMRSKALAVSLASTKYTVNESFFETIDTLEKCWALGWFFTDGFNRPYPPDSRITLSDVDEEVLVKLNALISNTRPLLHEPRYKRTSLIVSRAKFAQDLARHGCVQAKSLIVQYPHALLDTRAKTCAFLRGVLEGDGCIHISRVPSKQGPYVTVTISSSSPAFVESIRRIFAEYWQMNGIIQKSRTRPVVGIRFAGGRIKMKAMLEDIYDLSSFGLYLERKYRKHLEAIALLGEMIDNRYHQLWSKWGKPSDGAGVYDRNSLVSACPHP